MATAIGFKKVQSLPASPLISTFYLVNNEDLYIGPKKLNNGEDLADALRRIEALESATPGSGSGSGGTGTPGSAKQVRIDDTGNNFQATNVEDALAELAGKIGQAGGTFHEFIILRLKPSDFTGNATEGARAWKTATVPISKHSTKLIHAIPCGNTLGDMPTKEQEKRVFAMRGFLYPEEEKMVFYSPTIPEADVVMAIEGIEL